MNNEQSIKIGGTCVFCKASVLYPMPTNFEEVERWQRGELIQSAMPQLTADQREFMISSICYDCQSEFFD